MCRPIITGELFAFLYLPQRVELYFLVSHSHKSIRLAGMIDIPEFVRHGCIKGMAVAKLYQRQPFILLRQLPCFSYGYYFAGQVANFFPCGDLLQGKSACAVNFTWPLFDLIFYHFTNLFSILPYPTNYKALLWSVGSFISSFLSSFSFCYCAVCGIRGCIQGREVYLRVVATWALPAR